MLYMLRKYVKISKISSVDTKFFVNLQSKK